MEATDDDTLLGLQDRDDRNRDGVSDRAAIVTDLATGDRRVGRFGWKAQDATLLAFGADAYLNELGITNNLFRTGGAHGISGDVPWHITIVPLHDDAEASLRFEAVTR